ncbi:MAG: ankyrin repeat domain-containing protein [Verrucomicrobia bacterium]|nr:ankyrin repeat domain-containing protein [Verrucomicrobiota bacterium]
MNASHSFQITNVHTGIFRCAGHPGLLRAFATVLICGFSAVAMAAEIHDAVRTGDAATVARLLKKDPKLVNLPDEEHAATPLYHAVDTGNLELVKALLKSGAKVKVKTADGMTPMLRAAMNTSPEGIDGMPQVLAPIFRDGPEAARTRPREALKAFHKSLVLGREEEASRLAILRLLVERGGSVSDPMADTKWTPLHAAVGFPNIKAVEYLLEQRADPEATSALGVRPLHHAAAMGNPEVVKVLIAHMADVNAAQVPLGTRPLHFAVFGGNVATIRLLLDHGAEVNAVDNNGQPALHAATWSDEIFNLLLERGANPKLEQSDGTTTLHKACQEGSSTLVTKLLQLHPDLEACDEDYFTPLLNAAEAGRVDLLKLLVAAGANLKATQKDGRNALHLAANAASPEAVRFLLEQKLRVNESSDFGETALMIAAGAGQLESVTLLLRAGATVGGVDRRTGMTPLMLTALGNRRPPTVIGPDDRSVRNPDRAFDYLKIAELLLAGGVDLQARDCEGQTALHWAAISGNVEVLGLLISKGAEVDAKDTLNGRTPLHHAVNSADAKTVAILLDKGADITAKDSNGCQPIHLATQAGNVEVLHLLLEKGAAVAATESHGDTPLHVAAASAKLEAARMLLEHGAPPAALDQFKNSPLNMAATVGAVEIVRLLLDHRAPVNDADTLGNTPLHNAAIVRIGGNEIKPMSQEPAEAMQQTLNTINNSNAADKLKIVRLLLEKGAKPNAKNLEGATPIDAAAKFGTPEILAVLKSQATPTRRK